MKKYEVYKINSLQNFKGFDIGLSDNFPIGNSDELLKYPYIKYVPSVVISSDSKKASVCVLRFLEGTNNLQDFIVKEIKNWISNKKIPDTQKNIVCILEQIEKVFKTKKFDNIIEELLGDLGELFFLYKLEKMNVDWTQFYQKDVRTLFDSFFKVANLFVEIKTTTTGSKNIFIDLKQIIDSRNKKALYCCVCVEKNQNGLNILELVDKLKFTSSVLNDIKEKWIDRNSSHKNLIDSYTINEKTNIFFIDKELIPKLKLVHKGGYVGGKVKVLINENNKLDFEKTINFLLK